MAVFLVARSATSTRGAIGLWPVHGFLRPVFAVVSLGSVFSPALLAEGNPSATSVIRKAAARIDLSALGYREPSRVERLSDEASVSLDFVDRDHKANRTKVGKLSPDSKTAPGLPADVEVQHYGIDYAVNSSDLRFVPQQNEIRHSALQLMIAGFDDEGRQLSGFSALWASDLGPADYRDVVSGGVHIHQEVDVPVGAVSLRLGIEDQMITWEPSNSLCLCRRPPMSRAPCDTPYPRSNRIESGAPSRQSPLVRDNVPA
jgi:hypothetical protein